MIGKVFGDEKMLIGLLMIGLLAGCTPAQQNLDATFTPLPAITSIPTETPGIRSCPLEDSFEFLNAAQSLYQEFDFFRQPALIVPLNSPEEILSAMEEMRTHLARLEPTGCAVPLNTALERYIDASITYFESLVDLNEGRLAMEEFSILPFDLHIHQMNIEKQIIKLRDRLNMIRLYSPVTY